MEFGIRPSDVKKPLFDTVWQNSEKETVASNILKLARFDNENRWKPFTWEDYERFCSHGPSHAERDIIESFVKDGYLTKDSASAYSFTKKIIGVYMMYCD